MSQDDTFPVVRSTGLRGRPAAAVAWVLRLLPRPVRTRLARHQEVLKFLIVGGTCFMVAVLINYTLKLTVLTDKPLTALTIATLASTVVSYVLNREWAFRTRGGRERRHEAALFFAINGIAVVITDIPLWMSRYLLDLRVPDVSRLAQETADFLFGIVLGTLLAMVFRLWAYRKWVFPHPNVRLVRTRPHSDEEPDSQKVA